MAQLRRDKDGEPVLLEIKAEFLADYLTAGGMALYCSSYVERVAVTSTKPAYSWHDNELNEEAGRDQREARTIESSFPDPVGHFWTRGCLWRTEWVAPGGLSIRVRGDKDPYTTSFALETDGTRKKADQLAGAMAGLYFDPTLVLTLLRYRGARLDWYTQETGSLGASNFGMTSASTT